MRGPIVAGLLAAGLALAACRDRAPSPAPPLPPLGPTDLAGGEKACGDGTDNDGDGAADCADRDCSFVGACAIPRGSVLVRAGTFRVGSPPDEVGRRDNEAQRVVTLTRDYLIGTHEVTQGEFQAAMGFNPSAFSETGYRPPACGPDCPVEHLTWSEAAAYTNALSRAAGLAACYECAPGEDGVACRASTAFPSPYACPGFRLPTEAEWERAARAGTSSAFPNGGNLVPGTEDEVTPPVTLDNGEPLGALAWYRGTSRERTSPVGQLAPNPWGLFDVSGNVFEWCHDLYEDTPAPAGHATDPYGAREGAERSVRGGSLTNAPRIQRVSLRGGGTGRHLDLGFRVARTAP